MNFDLERLRLTLSTGRPLTIRQARGRSLRVLSGRVWLTQSGCRDDVFLETGATFRFDSDADTVVSAEGSAASVLFEAPLTIRSRSSLFDALKSMLGGRGAVGVN